MAHGSWPMAHDTWLMHGLMAHGPWLMSHDSCRRLLRLVALRAASTRRRRRRRPRRGPRM
eukprot:scaffold125452_cov51-Phaeocystis_antarctica.AAC.1